MTTVQAATHVRINPLTPKLGAVVEGVDARKPLGASVVADLKDALLRYKVLFLRRQNLDPDEHAAFARHFGEPFEREGVKFTPDYDEPGLTTVTVVPHFHSDLMYMEEQPAFAMLQLLEIPDVGGDTMWIDLVAGFEALSEPLRKALETLTAVHLHPDYHLTDEALKRRYKSFYGEDLTDDELRRRREASRPREHPVVRVIPETGRKNYWISAQHTGAIKGLTSEESKALLAFLFQHQLKPQFVVRWKWQAGDIAFWDHRTTLHAGIKDYGAKPRRGRRANIGVTHPIPAAHWRTG